MSVETLTNIVNQLLPEPHAGLLNGMLFGTKASLSQSLQRDLISSGTLHIIALSGMNITLLSGFVGSILMRIVTRRVASILTIVVIIGFIMFVGPSPSVVRAGVMGSLSLFAIISGKRSWPLYSWFIAVIGLLIILPSWLTDISFQLSALATLGIILFGNSTHAPVNRTSSTNIEGSPLRIKTFLRFGYTCIEDDLRVCLAAQVFTWPIFLLQFHRISLISPVANILVSPLVAPITILGWITVLLGFIWLPLGVVISWFDWVMIHMLLLVVTISGQIPFASFTW